MFVGALYIHSTEVSRHLTRPKPAGNHACKSHIMCSCHSIVGKPNNV